MKRFLLITMIFSLSFSAFSQRKNLSSEMLSAYKSGFYPGVVRFAEEILRSEKGSLAAFRAAVYEGESLFKMGRIPDSISILENYSLNVDSLNPETFLLNSAKFYWLGRGYFASGNLTKAQNSFFASSSIFKDLQKSDSKFAESSTDYFSLSIFYGAKCFFEASDYKNCLPLYEYVVSNGQKFSFEDYSDSALSLAQSYNFLGDKTSSKKCVLFVNQLENAKFDDEVKFSLLILKGEALEKLGEFKEAYETYSRVIQNAPAHLSAQAMQKAYAVSTLHRAEVGSEAGEVLSKAEGRLSEFPDLLSEFWTRLAVDAFNSKNYEKALSYFGEAESNASGSQKKIAAIYKAEISYLTSEDKAAGSKNSVEILQKSKKNQKATAATKNLDEMISLNLARFNAFLKNWKESEKFALEILQSENSEIKKNAVYWLSLAKYENGDAGGAAKVIENYNQDLSDFSVNSSKSKNLLNVKDKTILNLYAKALAKQGKYHEADEIFYSLGEKNQLDNAGHLDYSRTLLISGHYISTKKQAAKAKGDEAIYLTALADFNQRNWAEAANGFSKVTSSKTLAKDYVAFAQFYLGYSQYQMGTYSKALESLNRFVEENPLHEFAWAAEMTKARAAVFAKNDSEAIKASENAIKTARNESEKNEAIILSAGILSEAKKFDEALALLKPHISKRTEFGYDCKYRSAEILVQKGNFSEADKYFSELAAISEKSASLISEESSYRRAEIAYSQNDFAKSAEFFEEYSKKWPDGRFKFAAIYFSADSLAKTGDETLAILRYEQITDSKSETSYRYGAEKNLVDLYQKVGETQAALSMAQKMLDEYGEQAKNDGIDKKIKDIKQNAVWNKNSLEDRIKTAEKSLASQKNDAAESASNMKNAIFLAGEYRKRGENKKSAEMYLEAAKFSRIAGNDGNAARSFYGAIESFDAAGLYADEKATFIEMKKLYPENRYTREAEKIAGEL